MRLIPVKFCLALAFSLQLGGCVSSVEPDVDITPSPFEDKPYYAALTKATQVRTVFKDFETRSILAVTYLSPEFRSAFAERLERVYKVGERQFQEANDKAGFFVTVEVPDGDTDRTDLGDPHHWTLLMTTKDGPLKPVLIKRIGDKERWRAFFNTVNHWTSEYLVIFDVPSVNANSPQMVEKTPVRLMLANADAQVNLAW